MAAEGGSMKVVEFLVKKGADVKITDNTEVIIQYCNTDSRLIAWDSLVSFSGALNLNSND